MNETPTLSGNTVAKIDHFAERATHQAEEALASTRRAANGALDKIQSGVDHLREDTAGALGRAAAQVDDLTRRGMERARHASEEVRHRVERTNERTVGYIQSQPMKSVLIAAAAGAALAAVIGLLARSRTDIR